MTHPLTLHARGEACARSVCKRHPKRHAKRHFWNKLAVSSFIVLAVVASIASSLGETPSEEDNTKAFYGSPRLKESMTASLVGLNKRSGQAQRLRAPVGRQLRFETLTIHLVSCQRLLYPRHEDSAALLSISEREEGVLFKGWMYAQYPSLSAMDHPIYDVWVERCLP